MQMKDLAENLIMFYNDLELPPPKGSNIKVLNPYKSESVLEICSKFFRKYYSDNNSRILALGINPGRFGAGVTGISFTDPILLKKNLGLENDFDKKPELSATFIHEAINLFGGPENFYSKFHLSAICPLGFVQNGLNLNYYDNKELFEHTRPFIIETIEKQIDILNNRDFCICIGKGKNLEFLLKLNKEKGYFRNIIALPHPRWVLQYRRKSADQYFTEYVETFSKL